MKNYLVLWSVICTILWGAIFLLSQNFSGPLSSSVIGAPSSTLIVNGWTDIEVLRWTSASYTWTSTNADQFTGAFQRIGGPANRCGNVGSMPFNSAQGNFSNILAMNGAGCVYRVTFTAKNTTTNQSSTSTVKITVVAALSQIPPVSPAVATTPTTTTPTTSTVAPVIIPDPTATLTVNGGTDVQVVGWTLAQYTWKSTNAQQVSGSFTRLAGAWNICGNTGTMPFNTTNWTWGNILWANGVGCKYQVTFTVKNTSTGKIATSSVLVTVIAALETNPTVTTIPTSPIVTTTTNTLNTSPTAILKINNTSSSINVMPGMYLNTTWNWANATKYIREMKVISGPLPGYGAICFTDSTYDTTQSGESWLLVIDDKMIGCVFDVTFSAVNESSGQIAKSVIRVEVKDKIPNDALKTIEWGSNYSLLIEGEKYREISVWSDYSISWVAKQHTPWRSIQFQFLSWPSTCKYLPYDYNTHVAQGSFTFKAKQEHAWCLYQVAYWDVGVTRNMWVKYAYAVIKFLP